MQIKAIVFDMDDTLFSEEDYVYSGFKFLGQWVQEQYGKLGFMEYAWDLFCLGERRNIFNKTLEKMQIQCDQTLIDRMLSLYRAHVPHICLLPDAEWVLNHLRDDIKTGLISDGYFISQKNKVLALELRKWIQAVVLTDELGRECWKPSPVPYMKVCQELGVKPEECMYVGDNVTKDFIMANRLGWTSVHIDRRKGIYSGAEAGSEYQAHYKINDLRELSRLEVCKHLMVEEAVV